jgi:hypothetical protein
MLITRRDSEKGATGVANEMTGGDPSSSGRAPRRREDVRERRSKCENTLRTPLRTPSCAQTQRSSLICAQGCAQDTPFRTPSKGPHTLYPSQI